MPNWQVWITVGLVTMWTTAPAVFAQAAPVRCEAPENLRIHAVFRATVNDLISRSATLERQCVALTNAPDVTVTVLWGMRASVRVRAKATIWRSIPGRLQVMIELPVSYDFPELLAHELEHVLEQIEGVNLQEMVSSRHTGVYLVGENMYETVRARAAGRAALHELRHQGPDRTTTTAGQALALSLD